MLCWIQNNKNLSLKINDYWISESVENRPTSSSEDNIKIVEEMLTVSPRKSTRQAVCESGPTRHTVTRVLKSLVFHPWKPHYCQNNVMKTNHRIEYGETMLGWHED
ncbi:hypothetical protein J6590_069598 [Homalodisca vitripennis]|nr:hypothetical protein J6590_093498 [Homalodisca vitripennis]KAG8251935.1 hypothetical protein J6590_069598 [Homalodisca vitripennis]